MELCVDIMMTNILTVVEVTDPFPTVRSQTHFASESYKSTVKKKRNNFT